MGSETAGRRYVRAHARRAQIVDAAARLLLDQGYLPLAPGRLAEAVGVSKASIYNYFPDQQGLMNEVLERDFEALRHAGLARSPAGGDLRTIAQTAGEIYFRHVASRGPVAHYILRDAYMRGRLRPDLAAFRDGIMRNLARRLRREFGLSVRGSLASLNLTLTIPEEAGRLVWRGEISLEAGLELTRQLLQASLLALREVEPAQAL
ncbi:MAG: TetR/AcrR family transcriptional regulator [Phenylobacterium sp.]|jgi:AcrR family transcriptional regulator|uniref:TetR/AcrR family transcriptional regulator n=1 Tax=Phenylobacterium sp. TaxID=1871053 RepID=UPI003919A901